MLSQITFRVRSKNDSRNRKLIFKVPLSILEKAVVDIVALVSHIIAMERPENIP